MRVKKNLKNRGFFWKMVLSINAFVLLSLSILSLVIYTNAHNLLLDKEYDTSKKLLFQVKYNTDSMNQALSRLTQSLYLNDDVTAIMYAAKENMADVAVHMNKVIYSVTSANPYIHSISVYNRNLDRFYNAGSSLFFDDQLLVNYIKSDYLLPKLKPIYHDIKKLVNGKTESKFVFSYFMYETEMDEKRPNGAVIVNVKPEWLFENISNINMIDPHKGDSIFILDQDSEFVNADFESHDKMVWLKREFEQYKETHTESDGFFQSNYMGTQYLLSYSIINSIGMTLIKTQPVLEVYGYISKFKFSIIIITVIFLSMSIILTISISRRIYRPIGNLVHTISSGHTQPISEIPLGDEISYLDYVYNQTMQKLSLYNEERFQYKDVMKHYWLKRLLTQNLTLDHQNLERIFLEMKISLPMNSDYSVILLKIDNFREFQQEFSIKDKETIRYAMINITSEWIGKMFFNEGIVMQDDHVVLIASIPSEKKFIEEIPLLLREAQHYMKQFFKVTFTASVSDKTNNINTIPAFYNKALDQTVYRFHYGLQSILHSEYIHVNEENNKSQYSDVAEKRLLESIRLQDIVAAEEALNLLFDEIISMNYYNALVSTFKMVDMTKKALESSATPVTPSLLIDLSSLSLRIMEKETLHEVCEILIITLKDSFLRDIKKSNFTLDQYVVTAVTDYIRTNFENPSLSMSSIALMMKISSRQLSKLYKETMKISIPDFINEVRMIKAADLLTQKDITVNEIIEKVGILNETYFFSLFKKHHGMTPKEFALKNKAHQLINRNNQLND